MSFRNLLLWTPDLSPQLLGYTVTGTFPVTVHSNIFYDTTLFSTRDAARAQIYSIERLVDSIEGTPSSSLLGSFETPDTRVVSRFVIDTSISDLCVVSGLIMNATGVVAEPIEVRVSVHPSDMPMMVAGLGYLASFETLTYANCRGQFSIPMVRQSRVFIHIPAANLHGMLIIPDTDSANISTLTFEPVDLRRNS